VVTSGAGRSLYDFSPLTDPITWTILNIEVRLLWGKMNKGQVNYRVDILNLITLLLYVV